MRAPFVIFLNECFTLLAIVFFFPIVSQLQLQMLSKKDKEHQQTTIDHFFLNAKHENEHNISILHGVIITI